MVANVTLYIYIYIYIYIYHNPHVYIYICVCVCVCLYFVYVTSHIKLISKFLTIIPVDCNEMNQGMFGHVETKYKEKNKNQ